MGKSTEMVTIYRASPDDEIVDTQYGKIPYLKFLQKEKKRIEGAPNRKVKIVSAFGQSFLIADRIAGKKFTDPPWTSLMPKGQRKARSVSGNRCAVGNTE